MINLSRSEDKKALAGTITVYLLLFLLLFLMSMFNACSDVEAEEISSGGVAVSMGNPDDGGPDNSSAEEETIPESEEEYTPENQLTSDVAEAPPIIKNEPKITPKKPNLHQNQPRLILVRTREKILMALGKVVIIRVDIKANQMAQGLPQMAKAKEPQERALEMGLL